MAETRRTTAAEARRRLRGRNIALGLLVAGLAVLFYLITIARLGGGVS